MEELQTTVAAVGADESRHQLVGRIRQHELRVGVLQQRATPTEHRDLVAELDRFVDVMGDENDGFPEFALQPQNLRLQILAYHGVHRGERFVHQKDWRGGGRAPAPPPPPPLRPRPPRRAAAPVSPAPAGGGAGPAPGVGGPPPPPPPPPRRAFARTSPGL